MEWRLVDKLSGCMYVLVGLVRLHGTEKNSHLKNRTFGLLVISLALFSIVAFKVPVFKALPATFFLIMQILGIMKVYAQTEGVTKRDAIIWIVGTVLLSVLLFESMTGYEDSHPDVVSSFMAPIVVEEELAATMEDADDGGGGE